MVTAAKGARTGDTCARCGHPRNKHTTNPADGCTVTVWRNRRARGGRTRRIRHDCDCRYFVERTP